MRELLYITGAPASGKSTLAAGIVGSCATRCRVEGTPFRHTVYEIGPYGVAAPNEVCQLGGVRDEFSGTDVLGMGVAGKAKPWMAEVCPYQWVLGEGDRLATAKFFEACEESGWTIVRVHVVVPDAVADERIAGRGWEPKPAWLKGRRTKARNQEWQAQLVLDGTAGPETMVAEVARVSKVAQRLVAAQ